MKRTVSQTEPAMDGPPTAKRLDATLEIVQDDFDDTTHSRLDKDVLDMIGDVRQTAPELYLLVCIVLYSEGKLDPKYRDITQAMALLNEYPQLGVELRKAWDQEPRSFKDIRNLKILRPRPTALSTLISGQAGWISDNRDRTLGRLAKAYSTQFIGDTAVAFIRHLEKCDIRVRTTDNIHAKAISIVQSSGTGKSRMLTEVGNHVFTLPICLRSPNDPGYPPSDVVVYRYFNGIEQDNDSSLCTLRAISCFLDAAHESMLISLKEIQNQEGHDGKKILASWHRNMEHQDYRSFREGFFKRVVERANELRKSRPNPMTPSPKSRADGKPDDKTALSNYETHTKNATLDLMNFLNVLFPSGDPLCVTYFDDAHELRKSFWVMLRLLQAQEPSTKMWYVFMSTKSSISHYTPENQLSLKLREETRQFIPPYITLGFDQHAIARERGIEGFPVQDFETIDRLSFYGRPLWRASLQLLDGPRLIQLAAAKLIDESNIEFNAENKYHVFAVVAQRFCLDAVVSGAEAIMLADRSVAHHMRLLSGFSSNHLLFYTHSPSEPLLALAAAMMMYPSTDPTRLRKILSTLRKDLCGAGLVNKGDFGELCARILLLLARDYVATIDGDSRNLLKPVRLLDVLNKLFGTVTWASSNQEKFNHAFAGAHVNFTHWIVTEASLPKQPTKRFLANLWSRGAILQCTRNQSSIDSLCVVYFGSLSPGALFDVNQLGGFIVQVKNKSKAATPKERNLPPVGIPRDLDQPLPYLTCVMELGYESLHQETQSKFKTTAPEAVSHGRLRKLVGDFTEAENTLDQYRNSTSPTKTRVAELQEDVQSKRQQVEEYNRYSIIVRGASSETYGILTEAQIATEFSALLRITMPWTDPDALVFQQHMKPLGDVDEATPHTAWMWE